MHDTHRGYRRSAFCCYAAVLLVQWVCSRQGPCLQPCAAATSGQSSPGVVSSMLRENDPLHYSYGRDAANACSYRPSRYESEISLCEDDLCNSSPPGPTFGERFCDVMREFRRDVRCDYRNYYSRRTARDLLLGVGGAAVMANTTIDEKFQHWVQVDVRSSEMDSFASFWTPFGDGEIFIPALAGLSLVGNMFERGPIMSVAGDFGDRVSRSYLVGVPPMIFMQYCLGGSRPEEGHGSAWKPFDDSNGVSGHAFVGAVPFITAAEMSENCFLKGCFYFMSTLPAWARINDDSHYLSQSWMGWWMAYLACRAVNDTEYQQRCVSVAPVLAPGTIGMLFEYRR